MTRRMADACNIAYITPDVAASVDLVAYYVDGKCALQSPPSFPGKILVPISSIGTNRGTVLDVEPGNPDAVGAVDWVRNRRAAGVDPTLYVVQWAPGYTWADAIRAFDAAGERQPHYWVAPIGSGVIPGGAVAAQYAYLGGYDLSNVVDYWPGVDPPPAHQHRRDNEYMVRVTADEATGAAPYVLPGGYEGAAGTYETWIELSSSAGADVAVMAWDAQGNTVGFKDHVALNPAVPGKSGPNTYSLRGADLGASKQWSFGLVINMGGPVFVNTHEEPV